MKLFNILTVIAIMALMLGCGKSDDGGADIEKMKAKIADVQKQIDGLTTQVKEAAEDKKPELEKLLQDAKEKKSDLAAELKKLTEKAMEKGTEALDDAKDMLK